MEGLLDDFVLWSGWLAAVGIAIYEIVKAYRNRLRLEVSLTISQGDVCIGVHNWSRRSVNLVEAGLIYSNGKGSVYDDLSHYFPQLLYKNDGRNLCFKIADIVKELKSYDTEIMFGYFADEAGRKYKKKASDELKEYIRELAQQRKN